MIEQESLADNHVVVSSMKIPKVNETITIKNPIDSSERILFRCNLESKYGENVRHCEIKNLDIRLLP